MRTEWLLRALDHALQTRSPAPGYLERREGMPADAFLLEASKFASIYSVVSSSIESVTPAY